MEYSVEWAGKQYQIECDDDGRFIWPDGLPQTVAGAKLTVAANVLEHGTGAVNIDGCRIGVSDDDENHRNPLNSTSYGTGWMRGKVRNPADINRLTAGRWPANIILDDEAGRLLDAQSGVLHGKVDMTQHGSGTNSVYGEYARTDASFRRDGVSDTGGASRFFYSAKASRGERNAGLEGMPEHRGSVSSMTSRGERERGESRHDTHSANHHPTVKPLALMRYLCRLVTPPGRVDLVCDSCYTSYSEATQRSERHEGDRQNQNLRTVLTGIPEPAKEQPVLFGSLPGEESIDSANTVPGMRQNDQQGGSDPLLSGMFSESADVSPNVTPEAMRILRKDIHTNQEPEAVLLEGVLGAMERSEETEAGWTEDFKRVHTNSSAGSSDGDQRRVCDGASPSDVGNVGAIDSSDGSCASYQRDKGRQSPGEPMCDADGSSQQLAQTSQEHDHLPVLPCKTESLERCPQCGTTLRRVYKPSVILDPFAGSGSTCCAAVLEGFQYIGIDQDAEYCEIARKRIAHWTAEHKRMTAQGVLFNE